MTLCLNLSHDVMHDYNLSSMSERIFTNLFAIRNIVPETLWDEPTQENTEIINKDYIQKKHIPIKLLTEWFYEIQENEQNKTKGKSKPVLTKEGKTKAKQAKHIIDKKIKQTRANNLPTISESKEIVDTENGDTEIGDTEIVDTENGDTENGDTEIVDTENGDTENYNPFELEASMINVGNTITSYMGAKINEEINTIDEDKLDYNEIDYKEEKQSEPISKISQTTSFPGADQSVESVKTIYEKSGLSLINTFIDSLQAIKSHFSKIYTDFNSYLFNNSSSNTEQRGGNPTNNMLLALIEITNKIQEIGYNNETELGIIILFYFLKYNIDFKDNFIELCKPIDIEKDQLTYSFIQGYSCLLSTYNSCLESTYNKNNQFNFFKTNIFNCKGYNLRIYTENISFVLDASVEYYNFINIVINAYFTKILLESYEKVLNEKGTTLVMINSVCGCSAGTARPGNRPPRAAGPASRRCRNRRTARPSRNACS